MEKKQKKQLPLFFSLLALTAGSLAWNRQGQSARPSQEQPPQESSAREQSPDIPDHIAYLHLFRHTAAFKKKAEELERAGKDGSAFKTYFKRKAELNDGEAQLLDAIASECAGELEQQDAKAKVLIDAYKAQYPGGRVPHGEVPNPPPAELRAMSEGRDAIVLRYRDRLRATLGEDEFNRFQSFVKRRVVPNIHPQAGKQSPPSPADAR